MDLPKPRPHHLPHRHFPVDNILRSKSLIHLRQFKTLSIQNKPTAYTTHTHSINNITHAHSTSQIS